MADPSKTTSPFSFSQPATSGTFAGIFGQGTSQTSKQGGSIFGSGPDPPASSTSNVFGNTSTASAFNFNFGQPKNNNTTGGMNSQNNQPSNNAPSPTLFSTFATPNKASELSAGGQTQGGSTGTLPFGNLGLNAISAGQTSTTTPISKPTTNIFGNSTTPAGPPPSSGAAASSVVFGKPPQTAGNLFAHLSTTSSAPGASSSTAPTGGSSGFFSETSKSTESAAVGSSSQPASIFGSAPSAGGSNMFGNTGTAQPASGLFSNVNKAQGNVTAQQQNEPSKSLFSLGGQPTANTVTTQPATGSFASLLNKPASSGTSVPSTTTPTTSMFANIGKSQDAPTPSTTAPSSSFFSNLGKPQDKIEAPTSSAGTIGPSTSLTSTSNLAPSLFASKPIDKALTSEATDQPIATGTSQGGGGAMANLGASTAGPTPTPQSRLKNKSMDDIITRWAADLSKYQKEFQQQAQKVAAWDRLLVENSEKIQKLYGSTLEAERATIEVERQLTAVENDQAELSLWLDHYEKEVDLMISNSIGQGDTLSGPDQERERTYQMASKLQDRLDEMGKDLTGMIEEINDASSTLSKNNKADDPLSQVVRVLNSHLTQLQQIDQGAAALQAKVKESQRAGQTIGQSNGLSGPSSDAADRFYRSFMGRR